MLPYGRCCDGSKDSLDRHITGNYGEDQFKNDNNSTFVKCIEVIHPENKEMVELEVHLDPATGAMFAVDSSFLDEVGTQVFCPYPIYRKGTPESRLIDCGDPSDQRKET